MFAVSVKIYLSEEKYFRLEALLGKENEARTVQSQTKSKCVV